MAFLGEDIDTDTLISQVKHLFQQPQTETTPGTSSENAAPSVEGYQAPLKGTWRSSGGFTYQPNPTHPKGHMGVDMRAPAGTSVYPLAPGVVSNVGTDPLGGNVVNIQHANGVRTYYAHLSTAKVFKGDKVDNNTVIGTVGNTGNASHTFPHLHFQVWKNGQIQDPANFFTIPHYSNITAEEQRQGPWLSDRAKQDAAAFNMQDHVRQQRRMAFSKDVGALLKCASQYYNLTKKLSSL